MSSSMIMQPPRSVHNSQQMKPFNSSALRTSQLQHPFETKLDANASGNHHWVCNWCDCGWRDWSSGQTDQIPIPFWSGSEMPKSHSSTHWPLQLLLGHQDYPSSLEDHPSSLEDHRDQAAGEEFSHWQPIHPFQCTDIVYWDFFMQSLALLWIYTALLFETAQLL